MIRVAFFAIAITALASCAPQSNAPRTAQADGASVCKQIRALALEGRRANFAYDFADAERSFREIISLLENTNANQSCDSGLDEAVAQINLAISLSNQGQFRLANAAFREGNAQIEATKKPGQKSLSKLYEAYHSLNLVSAATTAPPESGPDLTEWNQLTSDPISFDAPKRIAFNQQLSIKAAGQLAREGLEALVEEDLAEAALALRDTLDAGGQAALPSEALSVQQLFEFSDEARDLLIDMANLHHARAASFLLRSPQPDLDNALAANDAALATIRGVDRVPGSYTSKYRAQRASIMIERGDNQRAVDLANAAATQLEAELPGTPLTAQAITVYATALERLGRFEEAKAAFDRAFSVYDAKPIPLSYERIFPYVRILGRDGADTIDEFDIQRRKIEAPEDVSDLFRAGQLVKSSNTAKDVAATAAAFARRGGDGAAAIRAWREAEKRVQTLRAALTQSSNLAPDQQNILRRDLTTALEEEADLLRRRDELAPEYREAIQAPVTLADIQATLKPGEALLQVLLGAPRSTIILVTPEEASVELVRLDLGEIDFLVSALTDSFPTGISVQRGLLDFSPELSHILTRQVFGSLLAKIRAQEKVFVSTNGVLQNIPFEVLVVEDPGLDQDRTGSDFDFQNIRWLVDDVAISYLPSPRNLIDLRSETGGSIASKSAIAFGDFLTDSENVAVSRGARTAQLPVEECGPIIRQIDSLDRLEGTAREVKAIGEALGEGTQIYTQQDFTEERIKALSDSGELADYRIVHFATHGLLWRSNDCVREPSLTTTVAAGSGEDGLLESSEIRQLNLNADLVVLSACETIGGDGQLGVGGENLVGLARAFFSSGARSVIASFWQAEDEPTAVLMATMYQRLADNPDTSFEEALRFAQGSVRRNTDRPEWANPVIWAPFVFVGDGSAKFRQAAG